MNNNISIKSINELLQYNFFIPSYQRGYRWTKNQTTDLLDDIWKFINASNKKDDEWYCLQPIVVKKSFKNVEHSNSFFTRLKQLSVLSNEQNALTQTKQLIQEFEFHKDWEIIDGQQRLTTIFLILKYLEQNPFEIKYETREYSSQFLNGIILKEELESDVNIDYHHIYNSFTTIKNWFQKKLNEDNSISSKFITPFLEKTKVIWYETDEKDAVQIFTRINMGKIALTNAELIKALFLNSSNFKTNNIVDKEKIRLKQLEIANEWDFIEYSLHNEEFWLFINKEENEKDTRIEFLFELIVGVPRVKNKNGKDFKTFGKYTDETDDTYYTFREFDKKFKDKSETEIEENWKLVKRYFQTLKDWFDNRELYHKIGFLITLGEDKDIKTLIEKSQTKSKTDFIRFIDEQIKKRFSNVQLAKIEYGSGIVRPILLLHNIQTMLNNTKENSRFPFNRYKKEKWDIEHIHAKASEAKVKDDLEEQRNWLIENFEEDKSAHNNDDLNKRIKNLIDKGAEKKDGNFQEIIEYVLGEEDDSLGNLCLLDRGTNRSYKNDSFKKKRKKIIEQEKKGTFIPICTRNVFMKYYSEELKQLGQWSEADRTAYFEDIKKVLPTQND